MTPLTIALVGAIATTLLEQNKLRLVHMATVVNDPDAICSAHDHYLNDWRVNLTPGTLIVGNVGSDFPADNTNVMEHISWFQVPDDVNTYRSLKQRIPQWEDEVLPEGLLERCKYLGQTALTTATYRFEHPEVGHYTKYPTKLSPFR